MTPINEIFYPFAWLDEILEITLNPAQTSVAAIDPAHLERLRDNFNKETRQAEAILKARTFSLLCKQEIETVVEYYYLAIRQLLRQAASNLQNYSRNKQLIVTGQEIKSILEASGERIRSRYQSYLPAALVSQPVSSQEETEKILFKMLIRLSGDQLGILIRAAYEANLIDAHSKRAAYRFLAPFLSTALKDELSDDSLRSNAGRPETKDLDVVVMVLQQLTEIVREYYRRR